ncbi:PepSY domain-containing protein [Pseudoalteromonas sp. N1230-9]|uniref:PepSY-associated TM helix domain-containing protein n=1 Tax=Pseudoalteromonas sp. N1230-9 TaxID=2907156 RepID=UPI002B319FA8|nr:PepSY domain-containing protein [Pseudoalteromonas sp. N1230-9]
MKENFFRSMTWLHTWVGLLVCWLLFLIFFAGTISFFKDEITYWSEPETHTITHQDNRLDKQRQQINYAVEQLQNKAADSSSWRIYLPEPRNPLYTYSYAEPKQPEQRRAKFTETYLDPATKEEIAPPRETKGGYFFYRLHFDLHYIDVRTARWLVCLASLFMLIALITGVVIHKRIFKDMFSFRKNKGSRSWLDAHNVSSVLALPFHIMITYTGLITLIFMVFPYPAQTVYEKGLQQMFNEASPIRARVESSDVPAPLVSMNTILDQVYTRSPDADIGFFFIRDANKESSRVSVYLNTGKEVVDNGAAFLFSGSTGELLAEQGKDWSASARFYDSMTALHAGRLASPLLRWLYFLCGIAGCAMIATGCIMWAKRLRERLKPQQQAGVGLKLVETLNLATLMGLPFATASFFIANRLLPLEMVARADKEILVFFLAWLAMTVLAIISSSKRQWQLAAWLNALVCFAVPLVNAMTTEGDWISYLLTQNWALFCVDFGFIIAGSLFILQGKKLRTASKKVSTRRFQKPKELKEQQG